MNAGAGIGHLDLRNFSPPIDNPVAAGVRRFVWACAAKGPWPRAPKYYHPGEVRLKTIELELRRRPAGAACCAAFASLSGFHGEK